MIDPLSRWSSEFSFLLIVAVSRMAVWGQLNRSHLRINPPKRFRCRALATTARPTTPNWGIGTFFFLDALRRDDVNAWFRSGVRCCRVGGHRLQKRTSVVDTNVAIGACDVPFVWNALGNDIRIRMSSVEVDRFPTIHGHMFRRFLVPLVGPAERPAYSWRFASSSLDRTSALWSLGSGFFFARGSPIRRDSPSSCTRGYSASPWRAGWSSHRSPGMSYFSSRDIWCCFTAASATTVEEACSLRPTLWGALTQPGRAVRMTITSSACRQVRVFAKIFLREERVVS